MLWYEIGSTLDGWLLAPCEYGAVFTPVDRAHLRDELVSAPNANSSVTGLP